MKSIKEMKEFFLSPKKTVSDSYKVEYAALELLAWAEKARELLMISIESDGWLPKGDEWVKKLLAELPEEA